MAVNTSELENITEIFLANKVQWAANCKKPVVSGRSTIMYYRGTQAEGVREQRAEEDIWA